LPQSGVHTPPIQVVHGGHVVQSAGQVLQSSLQDGSHKPLPQFGWHVAGVPAIQVVHARHPQSAGQLLQSSQAGLQMPLPQSGEQAPAMQLLQSPHPQSAGQVLQFSQAGSQVPSPQADTQEPFSQF
jgi:hypothetical protein